MSIDEAIDKILQLPQKVGEKGVEIMKNEVPYKKGGLYNSIKYEVMGSSVFIGTDKEYAKYVEYGRGEVRPVKKQALMWEGLPHPVMRSSPTKPNDFVGRTASQLSGVTFIL